MCGAAGIAGELQIGAAIAGTVLFPLSPDTAAMEGDQ